MTATLMNINPFVRSGSIFSDMTPVKEPSSIPDALVTSDGGGVFSLAAIIIGGVCIAYFLVSMILSKRGISLLPIIDRYIESKPKRVYFGSRVSKSDLVTTLISFITILSNQKLVENVSNKGLINRVEDNSYFILQLLKKEDGVEALDLLDRLDTSLAHDSSLMLKLISYVETTKVLRESVLVKSLESISDGLDKVLAEYKTSMSQDLEYELEINSELKAREKEQVQYMNSIMTNPSGMNIPEPTVYSDDPFIDAMMRRSMEQEDSVGMSHSSSSGNLGTLYSSNVPRGAKTSTRSSESLSSTSDSHSSPNQTSESSYYSDYGSRDNSSNDSSSPD